MPQRGHNIPSEGADLIRDRLKELGYSQENFAEDYLRVSDRTLRNWLSGRTSITTSNLESLLIPLGIGVEDIFVDDIPREFSDKGKLGKLIRNIREVIQSGELGKIVEKYKEFIQALSEHVSFYRVPPKGPFVAIEHDESHSHHYAHIEIEEPEERIEIEYRLSFQFLRIVRVNIGDIIVKRETITAKPFFQKYPHTIQRNTDDLRHIHFAMWFDARGTMFFIESKDHSSFNAEISEILTEQEYSEKEKEIAVFWKGVWH